MKKSIVAIVMLMLTTLSVTTAATDNSHELFNDPVEQVTAETDLLAFNDLEGFGQLGADMVITATNALAMQQVPDVPTDEDTPQWVIILSYVLTFGLSILSYFQNNLREKYKNEAEKLKAEKDKVYDVASSKLDQINDMGDQLLEAPKDGNVSVSEIEKFVKSLKKVAKF